MRGTFEWAAGEQALAREAWALVTHAGGRALRAHGAPAGGTGPVWTLEAVFDGALSPQSLDIQVKPADHPSQVTTAAFRCFAGRAFGTMIPPGGVPEKIDTAFPPGSAFRGFSLALDGLAAEAMALRVGHARRLLVIELGRQELAPRITDEILLATARERVKGQDAQRMATAFEFRSAQAPGVAGDVVVVGNGGVVVRASKAGGAGATCLAALEG